MSSPPSDDNSKDKNNLPDNELEVPILIKSKGVSQIIRYGGHKEGFVMSMSDPFQLVRKERWQCVSCNKLIEKIVINMLEPIKTPKGCSYCRGSVIAKHEFIDARTLRIQHDDVTATDSMDSLSVIV